MAALADILVYIVSVIGRRIIFGRPLDSKQGNFQKNVKKMPIGSDLLAETKVFWMSNARILIKCNGLIDPYLLNYRSELSMHKTEMFSNVRYTNEM